MPSTEQPETWELLNDELRHRLDVQRSSAERIETKAAVVIGAALTAVQFVVREPVRSYWLPPTVGAYVAAMIFGLLTVMPRVFDETGPKAMLTGLWLYPRGRAAAELANNRLLAYEGNLKRHRWRLFWLRLSLLAVVVGAIMSVIHLTEGVRA
jgi:hypothetical protein